MKYILYLVTIIWGFSMPMQKDVIISRMTNPTIDQPKGDIIPLIVNFNDTIAGDTLFLQKTENGLTHSYFRKVMTGVCIDGECRLLNITLYWNPTGRYLGFKLPPGEFLSKTEHVEFTDAEYNKLHELMQDSYSTLANYTIKELVPVSESIEVDATTSATIQDVLDYIVEDAVYTTYTIWHIVYGNTQKIIQDITKKSLNDEITLALLSGESVEDLIWTLEKIKGEITFNDKLNNRIIELINNENFYLSEKAISALDYKALNNLKFQNNFFNKFNDANYFIKRLMLQKLNTVNDISPEIIRQLTTQLDSFNGTIIRNVLTLLETHQINDDKNCMRIAALLKNKNNFIAQAAYNYLNSVECNNKKIARMMKRFSK